VGSFAIASFNNSRVCLKTQLFWAENGCVLVDSNVLQTVFSLSKVYFALGYSVIPLYGEVDPSRPKVAAVAWAGYQKVQPSLDQLQKWFCEDQFAGLGIVTGSVSRLAVLDFDAPEAFEKFRHRYPHLIETKIVQTRRGYHLYFRLPLHLRPPTRKGSGVDFLSEGSYVVAPPTRIEGHTYTLHKDCPPYTLRSLDVFDIHTFMDSCARSSGRPVAAASPTSPPSQPSTLKPHRSEADLLALYRYLVEKGDGRNRALFQAGLLARDSGWSEDQALRILGVSHVGQPAAHPHVPETPESRFREAVATIRSVYSRPPCLNKVRVPEHFGLPNTVREQLLLMKCIHVIRVWEGLRLKGIQPGDVFTVGKAAALLAGVVGRDSVYHALEVVTGGGVAIFERVTPPNPPQASNDAAVHQDDNHQTKCIFGRAEKSGIIRRGPKARLFIMPAPLDLCRKLNLLPSHSDPLLLDDLTSVKQTRMAVHREFIKRAPGSYPRRWLARRLGVCIETLDTYNHDSGICRRHQYIETPISWANLDCIPDDMLVDGTFLQDETGKHYPALRALAARLLKEGKSITYKRQDANYYWCGQDAPPDLSILYGLRPDRDNRTLEARQHIRQYWENLEAKKAAESAQVVMKPKSALIPDEPTRMSLNVGKNRADAWSRSAPKPELPAQKRGRDPTGRRSLDDEALEKLACHVQERINSFNADPNLHISLAVSRRLVSQYDRSLIEAALKLLGQRRNVTRPAGFFITVLRSESKRGNLARA
jgi:hypothetical protein